MYEQDASIFLAPASSELLAHCSMCGNRLRDINRLRENMEFMMEAQGKNYDWFLM